MGEYISHLTSPIFYLRGFPPSRTAFPAFPCCEAAFPICRGTAEGRATGPTTHEARFNVASGSSRPREARPRQFSRFGAVARRAETCASVSAARPCRSVVDHATGRILTTDVHGRASLTLAPKIFASPASFAALR